MKFYRDLTQQIDDYQINNFIPYRNVAILELTRLGLYHQKSNHKVETKGYGEKGDSFLQLNLSFPAPLLKKIDFYKEQNSISTRSGAITELIQIGLQHPF